MNDQFTYDRMQRLYFKIKYPVSLTNTLTLNVSKEAEQKLRKVNVVGDNSTNDDENNEYKKKAKNEKIKIYYRIFTEKPKTI